MRLTASPGTIADRAAVIASSGNVGASEAVDMALCIQVEAERRLIQDVSMALTRTAGNTSATRYHTTHYDYTPSVHDGDRDPDDEAEEDEDG